MRFITSDIGMYQFTKLDIPHKKHGYTLDDNARALYVLTTYHEAHPEDSSLDKLFATYLNFIENCQLADGTFLNYQDKKGVFTSQNDDVNMEESSARAFLALARFYQSSVSYSALQEKAAKMIQKCLPHKQHYKSPRAVGKILKGLALLHQANFDADTVKLSKHHAEHLRSLYRHQATEKWNWFEPHLSYSNSDLSEGLLYSYLIDGSRESKQIGLKSLDFLMKIMFKDGMLIPVSHREHLNADNMEQTDFYGQQPVEVASIIECLNVAYEITEDDKYYDMLMDAFTWFLGNNVLNEVVYGPATGSGHDGIEKHGVNLNQGAESTLSYVMSLGIAQEVHEHKTGVKELVYV